MIAALALSSSLGTACSSDETHTSDDPNRTSGSSTTPEESSTTSTMMRADELEDSAAAELAVAYHEAVQEASIARDPNHPSLSTTMTGEALEFWQSKVEWLLEHDAVISQDPDQSTFVVVSVETKDAVGSVTGCLIDSTRVLDATTGKVLDDRARTSIQQHRIVDTDDGPRIDQVEQLRVVSSC